MSDDLKVWASVGPDAVPLVRALRRLHRDLGSVAARHVWPDLDATALPPGARLLCVGCADEDDVQKLSRDLRRELHDDLETATLASKVAVITVALDLRVVAFVGFPVYGAVEGKAPL